MKVTVETLVQAEPAHAWHVYNTPEHIMRWNAASDDWHSPASRVDLREGGTFSARMEAKDGSMGFDFEGTYTRVVPQELIEYRMADGREVAVHFVPDGQGVRVRVAFDPDREYPAEYQQEGWQAILDNFGRHAEASARHG